METSGCHLRFGGGVEPAIENRSGLLMAFDLLVHQEIRRTPMLASRWTSTYQLARECSPRSFEALRISGRGELVEE